MAALSTAGCCGDGCVASEHAPPAWDKVYCERNESTWASWMKDPAGTCSSCHSPANAQTREGRGWEERTEREEGEGGSEMKKNLLGRGKVSGKLGKADAQLTTLVAVC